MNNSKAKFSSKIPWQLLIKLTAQTEQIASQEKYQKFTKRKRKKFHWKCFSDLYVLCMCISCINILILKHDSFHRNKTYYKLMRIFVCK